MNQTQLKYARERAERIYNTAVGKLKEKHTVQAIDLDYAEIRKALGNREFKVKPDGSGWRLRDYVTFPQERPSSFDTVSFEIDKAALRSQYDKLTDELVLGDQTEALKLLQAFEAANGAN